MKPNQIDEFDLKNQAFMIINKKTKKSENFVIA
jgi:hypothetical protein